LGRLAAGFPSITFYGVTRDSKASDVEPFLAKHGNVQYAQILDPDGRYQDRLSKIAPRGLPLTLVLDADRRLVARRIGRVRPGELEPVLASLVDRGR
jgi:hypothetical protein